MFVKRLFPSIFRGDVAKPKSSAIRSAVKFALATTAVLSSYNAVVTYRGAHRTLETRKYVDINYVRSLIPKNRNVVKDQDLTKLYKAIIFSTTILLALRNEVEPTIPEDTKKRYSEEASAERKVLMKALFFGTDKKEGKKIMSEVLPYFLNDAEIESLNQFEQK